MICSVSSRTARPTQRNPVSKNKTKTNKQKKDFWLGVVAHAPLVSVTGRLSEF